MHMLLFQFTSCRFKVVLSAFCRRGSLHSEKDDSTVRRKNHLWESVGAFVLMCECFAYLLHSMLIFFSLWSTHRKSVFLTVLCRPGLHCRCIKPHHDPWSEQQQSNSITPMKIIQNHIKWPLRGCFGHDLISSSLARVGPWGNGLRYWAYNKEMDSDNISVQQ